MKAIFMNRTSRKAANSSIIASTCADGHDEALVGSGGNVECDGTNILLQSMK